MLAAMSLDGGKLKSMRSRIVARWATSRLPVYVATMTLAFAAGLSWATDWITIQDERTVYTAECRGGDWQGAACTGHLVAGARYQFRASKNDEEVAFWIVGD